MNVADRDQLAVLREWLQQLPSVVAWLVRPRVPDLGGIVRSVDAVVLDESGEIHLIDVWWSASLPLRDLEGRVSQQFDGFTVSAMDPGARLVQMAAVVQQLREVEDQVLPSCTLVAPNLDGPDLNACRGVWPRESIRIEVGAWPSRLGSSPSSRSLRDANRRAFERLARDPMALLEDEGFNRRLSWANHELAEFLEESGDKQAARRARERWARVDQEPLTVAMLGTFSAGKTSLLNGLTHPYGFPVGDTPTTSQRVIVKYGVRPRYGVRYMDESAFTELREEAESDPQLLPRGVRTGDLAEPPPHLGSTRNVPNWASVEQVITDVSQTVYVESVVVELPIDELKRLEVWDLPGTDSDIALHKRVTRRALEDVDAAVYVFSAAQPFSRQDLELLNLIAAKRNLADADRFLFLANRIDQVRPAASRASVLARCEGELFRRFGLERCVLKPTCLLLSDAKQRLETSNLTADEREDLELDLEDAIADLGLSQDLSVEQSRVVGGVEDVRLFLDRLVAEKRLMSRRSLFESSMSIVRARRRVLRQSLAALEATQERIVAARKELEEQLIVCRRQLEALSESSRIAAEREVRDAAAPAGLSQKWHRAVEAFAGNREATEQALSRETSAWVQEATRRCQAIVESHKVKLGAAAMDSLRGLREGVVEQLTGASPALDTALVGSSAAMGRTPAIDWAVTQEGSVIQEGSKRLATEFFNLAVEVDLGSNLLAVIATDAAWFTAVAAGLAVRALGEGLDLVVSGGRKILEFFRLVSPRDVRAQMVNKLKSQLSEVDARKTTSPMRRSTYEALDQNEALVVALFDVQADAIRAELVRSERALDGGSDGLKRQRKRVSLALSLADTVEERLAKLRAQM